MFGYVCTVYRITILWCRDENYANMDKEILDYIERIKFKERNNIFSVKWKYITGPVNLPVFFLKN